MAVHTEALSMLILLLIRDPVLLTLLLATTTQVGRLLGTTTETSADTRCAATTVQIRTNTRAGGRQMVSSQLRPTS